MIGLIIFLALLIVVLAISFVFVGKELLKKFWIWNNFVKKNKGYMKTIPWISPRIEQGENRIIRFSSEDPFVILVGFSFNFFKCFFGKKVDPFIYGKSVFWLGCHEIIWETYLRNPVLFLISTISLNGTDTPIEIECGDEIQNLSPNIKSPAHWFQKIGKNRLQKN